MTPQQRRAERRAGITTARQQRRKMKHWNRYVARLNREVETNW